MAWDKFESRVEKGPMSAIFALFGPLLTIFVIVSIIGMGTYYLRLRYFAPVVESAKRHVYEQNRSYVAGNIEELRRLKLQYDLAEDDEKETIAEYIRGQFGSFDRTNLPDDLIYFLENL